ncbi:hypothetical protein BGX28_010365 [Mortierella sp. GBA30]|nr:hypothetical protein BGX28_010365 [Mortierella sp. GBA30]
MDSGSRDSPSNDQNNHIGQPDRPDKAVSSSSSAGSLTSWRSKGAEMLTKSWGRSRKNSEPLLSTLKGPAPNSPIFGANLDDAIQNSHIPDTPLVPAVLYRCAVFLEARGVDEVGLYRVPGSHANVQKLKRMFDTGKDYDLLAMDGIDPNDIATLLKLYLRELPTPLLPPTLLEQFQSLLSTDVHICHTLRGILIRLPRPNYVVLSYLCHHLSKIASHSERTKMTVSNLGVVFAPTLSIGSVLFKALLGGFYNGIDTSENREIGLKIVWGGLLQDMEYHIHEWPEDEADSEFDDEDDGDNKDEQVAAERPDEKQEYHETDTQQQPDAYIEQSQHLIRHQESLPTISPFGDQYVNNSSSYMESEPDQTLGPAEPSSPRYESPDEDPFDDVEENDSDESEDVELMNAMLLREEMAATAAVPSPGAGSEYGGSMSTQDIFTDGERTRPVSHLTLAATTPSGHTMAASTLSSSSSSSSRNSISSRNSDDDDQSEKKSILSTTAAKPLPDLPQMSNVTIDTGAAPSVPTTVDTSTSPPQSYSVLKSATGAPQLPPIDPISISL